MGIILYISAVNDEVGHRPKTAGVGEPKFSYFYGWSFFFAGVSFITAEMAAVFGISLYLLRNAHMDDMIRIIPGLEDKLDSDYCKEDETAIQSTTIILWAAVQLSFSFFKYRGEILFRVEMKWKKIQKADESAKNEGRKQKENKTKRN